jgi:hypothetical protein
MGVHTEHHHVDLEEKFVFTSGFKTKLYISFGIGLALFLLGIYLLMSGGSHEAAHEGGHEVAAHGGEHAFNWVTRLWATLWVNSVYFTGIALVGVFFIAYNYVAYAGWSSVILRIPQAFGFFLPVAAVFVIGVAAFGGHDLFHWMHHGITEEVIDGKPNPGYDAIIAGKSGYLNPTFFWIRLLTYFTLWISVFFVLRKLSLKEDLEGGVKYHDKSIVWSAIFLLIFGVSSSMSAWDWVMSIDTHWFSTMFGWYVLASWHVSGLAAITLTVVLLKENGYLKMVNESHLHDLGKFMFAFSIFWCYVWFSQFLLIFYANISEETTYFLDRLSRFGATYKGLFFFNIFINFVFPFLTLMTRDAKRLPIFLKIASIAILFGHWLDFYMMVMPGTTKGNSGFGPLEWGSIIVFASLFIFVVASALSKALLVPKNHPYVEESMHHDI